MKIIHHLTESLADDAAAAEEHHIADTARISCFNIAQEAILLHKLLQSTILEEKDSWIIERLDSALHALRSIAQFTQAEVEYSAQPTFEDASAGGTGSGAIASVSSALMPKPIKRKMREGTTTGTTGTIPTTAGIGAGGAKPAGAAAIPAANPAAAATAPGAASNPAAAAAAVQKNKKIADTLKKSGNTQLAAKLASPNAANKFDQSEIAAITAAST